MSVPQSKHVTLRCGLGAWVAPFPDYGNEWHTIGHIVFPGGRTEGPHLWRENGSWAYECQHALDIVRLTPPTDAELIAAGHKLTVMKEAA